MAVTLTVAQLAVELRIITSEDATIPAAINTVLTRSLAAATEAVQEYAPGAPEALQNEATVRLAARLYDATGNELRGGNPFVQSGAAALLSRHRSRSVRVPSGTAAAGGTSTGDGVDEAAVNALIQAALATHTANANAHHAPPDVSGFLNAGGVAALIDGRIPAAAAARIPRAPGSVNNKVWKTGPAGEAPDWRDDDTTAGAGSHNDATARSAAAAAQGEADHNRERIVRLEDLTVDIEDDDTERVWQAASVATQGGMEAVSALPATAAAAAQEFGAADGTNSISLADGASQTILWRIPAMARRTFYRIEAAGSLQVSNTTYIGGIGSNTSGAWSYYGTTVKNVSGGATDVKLELQDDVYTWLGKTLWTQVEGQHVDQRLADLANLTSDLHAGNPATGWSDISAASQGGIREGVGGGPWTLTTARAVADADWRMALTEPQAQFQYGLIRIPASADPRSYRLEFTALPEDGGTVATGNLTHWTRLGESSDGNWQYYTGPGRFGDVAVTLQATGSAAHVGTSTFAGKLAAGIVKLAALSAGVAARLLPASGGGVGKFLGWSGSSPAWVDPPSGGALAVTLPTTSDLPLATYPTVVATVRASGSGSNSHATARQVVTATLRSSELSGLGGGSLYVGHANGVGIQFYKNGDNWGITAQGGGPGVAIGHR
ncbi:MAG: hypothetical protein OXG44_06245 [Gammaproteobacteria bacterium]|nr:hypothetical protein [Gammaproteobacteria bacterium]